MSLGFGFYNCIKLMFNQLKDNENGNNEKENNDKEKEEPW